MKVWRDAIARELRRHQDNFVTRVQGLTDEDFDAPLTERVGFTIWTAKRVYFPVCTGNLHIVASVSRYPIDEIFELKEDIE